MLSAREGRAEMIASALIQPLTAADIPALEKLEAATRLAFWGREHYRKFLEEYPEYFGAKAVLAPEIGSTKLVGFILSRSIFDNLEILKVGVHPDHHRRGIGTILIQSAFEEGLRRGCRRCFLEVRKSNLGAIEFYYRHNFRMAGSRINYYTDPVEDAWIMERSLK
ncbi:MAG: ribosomal-protein-alanine N-acetyltransferase [Acidobacteria bacterium]|nr:MAG: ribosomal-protein-alanine N-acetyltransferase [Acidobacteriota bacterium]PYU99508.1 MAG: ribosomal-protein-alanine N-acetyltransferase [Acidobacteriota bacterium]PYV39371.1 MAG: ribosomal-protein-alanine N-acetyltransferase [Acidobacteriota bacterium]